jgi:hypothetical protein
VCFRSAVHTFPFRMQFVIALRGGNYLGCFWSVIYLCRMGCQISLESYEGSLFSQIMG